jgi:putative exporter of polyketide antibiotics
MIEVSELLGQSNVIRSVSFGHRRGVTAPVLAWVLAALIAAVYFALSIVALKISILDGWALLTGPTSWTGLASMTAIVFVAVGGALTASQWTMARGGRRRYRSRQRRLLDV